MSFGKQNKLIWLSAHAVSTQWKGFYVAIKKNEVYLYSLIWNNNLDKLGITIINRPGKPNLDVTWLAISCWHPTSPKVGELKSLS